MELNEGCVYIIRSGNSNLYKVGHSIDPVARCAELQVGSAAILRIVGTLPGSRSLEASLHVALRGKRVHGEWFRLTSGDVKELLRSGVPDTALRTCLRALQNTGHTGPTGVPQ